jgi:prevent-host-death family protein
MTRPSWSLQDAKNRFSTVVDAAVAGEPQLVTRHGRPAVFVVSAEAFERMRQIERAEAPSFAEMLLSMPQDDGDFERADVTLRDVEF